MFGTYEVLMTLYDDFLWKNDSYDYPELPVDCIWISEEICNGGELDGDICQASLIMFLEKMHDRIKELENQVQFLKGEM